MLRQHAGPPFPTDYFLPPVIVVLIFQRRIIAGLTAGGVK
jgi:ABC-type glycerol-3-phosphate transport system permease component